MTAIAQGRRACVLALAKPELLLPFDDDFDRLQAGAFVGAITKRRV